MGLLTTIIGGAGSTLLNSVKGVINSVVPDATQRDTLNQQIEQAIIDSHNKLSADAEASITTEESGNWLQKSWRPLIMLSFALIILYQYFFSQIFKLPVVTLPDQFFHILEIGIGGYIGLRSAEKVTDTLVNKK